MRYIDVHITGIIRFDKRYKCNGTGTGSRKRHEKMSTQHGRQKKSSWSFGKMKPRGEYNISVPFNKIITRINTNIKINLFQISRRSPSSI